MRESWYLKGDCQWTLRRYLKSKHSQFLLNFYLLLKGFLRAFQEILGSDWVFGAGKRELIIRKRKVAIAIWLILEDVCLMSVESYLYLLCEIILALS